MPGETHELSADVLLFPKVTAIFIVKFGVTGKVGSSNFLLTYMAVNLHLFGNSISRSVVLRMLLLQVTGPVSLLNNV
jgi:hypothetical protein